MSSILVEARGGSSGSFGPRLAGRLTADLISHSHQYMSCVKMYEIDLKGNKIAQIENLGATENQFDSIDLSDNAITLLQGFPRLLRLKQLLMNNNRIMRIDRKLEESIPNLETLILTNNRLADYKDIDPLASLPKLQMLSLMGNPVALKLNYRLYVISKCPGLKILDFKKVRSKEREEALKKFPLSEEGAAAANGNGSSKTFEPDEDLVAAQAQAGIDPLSSAALEGNPSEPSSSSAAAAAAAAATEKKGPTPAQMLALQAAIANAATLEEIQRLEAALTSGHLPSELEVGDGPSDMEIEQ